MLYTRLARLRLSTFGHGFGIVAFGVSQLAHSLPVSPFSGTNNSQGRLWYQWYRCRGPWPSQCTPVHPDPRCSWTIFLVPYVTRPAVPFDTYLNCPLYQNKVNRINAHGLSRAALLTPFSRASPQGLDKDSERVKSKCACVARGSRRPGGRGRGVRGLRSDAIKLRALRWIGPVPTTSSARPGRAIVTRRGHGLRRPQAAVPANLQLTAPP